MRAQYNPTHLALVGLAIVAVLMLVMLFIPPYLGLSNDGSFDAVLADTGLERLDSDDSTSYFSYYERVYLRSEARNPANVTTWPLRLMVGAAKLVDDVFSPDEYFDMRALAAIYALLYLAVLFPLMRDLLSRVGTYSSGLLLMAIMVLVFADSTIVTRFASLYTQPIEWLLMLAMLDVILYIARQRGIGLSSATFAALCVLLMAVNRYCCMAGIVFALAFWLLTLVRREFYSRAGYIICAMALVVVSVMTAGNMVDSQTLEEKYNQMTRGILFEAKDPGKALAQFDIDERYSILTDTYADQQFPVVALETGVLDEGFFDRYTTGDIVEYFVLHPGAMISMLDNGVHNAFTSRSDYSGNYEKSAGKPAMAKTLFVSVWSTFKERSAPRTIGTLVILMFAVVFSTRRKKDARISDEELESSRILNTLFYSYMGFFVVELITVIIMSGDSEFIRESTMMGGAIDILFVWFMASVLNKTGNIEKET